MKNEYNDYEITGILPVINIPTAELAVPVAKALNDGGVCSIEVTLRSADSLVSLERIKQAFPGMSVGAGTVLDIKTVDAALEAGADFIVSPGYDEEIVNYCINKGVLTVPGCTTASAVQHAAKKGLSVLKFFPAELSGGISAIKLLSGPFPHVKFIPTGGITFSNLGTYLENKSVLACGGSFMATADQIKNEDYSGITAACKKAIDISLGFELAHVGVNNENTKQAEKGAEKMSGIFRLPVKAGNSSVFSGTAVEFMKTAYYGKNGHIGFKTNSMERALAYLKKCGVSIIEESVKRDAKGDLVSAYLKDEIGGFAVHIVRK